MEVKRKERKKSEARNVEEGNKRGRKYSRKGPRKW